MKTQKVFTYLLFFLFSFSLITAYNLGDDDYYAGNGVFNPSVTDVTTLTKGTGTQRFSPITCDTDNDLINEIITYSGNNLYIYDSSLTLLKSFSIPEFPVSNIYCQDIDNDNLKDIIFAVEDTLAVRLYGFEYNGTDLIQSFNHTFSLSQNTKRCELGCNNNDKCVIVCMAENGYPSFNHEIGAYGFNSTNISAKSSKSSATGIHCLPQIKELDVSDIDGDGVEEFITGGAFMGGSVPNEGYWLRILNVALDTLVITDEYYAVHQSEDGMTSYTDLLGGDIRASCLFGNAEKYASVTVVDADGSTANGEDIMVGLVLDADAETFKLYRVKGNDPTQVKDFPGLSNGRGNIVSNTVKADIFHDTDNDDFCVMGVRSSDNFIDIVCGSDNTAELVDSMQFGMVGDYYTDSTVSSHHVPILHSGDFLTEVISISGNNNPTEFITSYGVLKASTSSNNWNTILPCYSDRFCDLQNIYNIGFVDGAVYPIDIDGTGFADLLLQRNTSIAKISDNVSNLACDGINQNCITEIQICPLEGGSWLQNTSVEFTITTFDQENDRLFYNITLYYAHPTINEIQKGYKNVTSLSSSGYSFESVPNITNSANYKIDIYDAGNPSTVFSYGGLFSVSGFGAPYGQECSIQTFDAVPVGLEATDDITARVQGENDAITSAIDEVTGMSGLSKLAIWLIIMVIVGLVGLGSITAYSNISVGIIMAHVGVTAFLEVLLIFLGYILGYVPVGWVLTLILMGVIIAGIVITKFFSNSSGG